MTDLSVVMRSAHKLTTEHSIQAQQRTDVALVAALAWSSQAQGRVESSLAAVARGQTRGDCSPYRGHRRKVSAGRIAPLTANVTGPYKKLSNANLQTAVGRTGQLPCS
ncbi:hypothetical protein AcV5_003374 [Taiwanofungus camphoratus]|nr:hypothetical protein AcV5_003374 [Antrodia cinnamomea]